MWKNTEKIINNNNYYYFIINCFIKPNTLFI